MNYIEFKKNYNIRLNEQQEKAVMRSEGQTLLLAVPGSGKTTVIVARLGYLLMCCGVRSENILTMTYNVSAAADMKNRYIAKFGEENLGRLEFRTINGFCATVIMRYERVRNTKAFSLIEESGSSRIIRSILLEMTGEYPTESTVKELKTNLVYSRNMMLNDEEIRKIKCGEIDFYDFFTKYRRFKQENRIMDYDDQLEFALRILVKNPDILEYYQNRYRFVNIDEAQDTSKIQHMIIRLLVKKYKNIFMVGDEDQSIYGFRAAYPQALLEFDKVYPSGQILLMERNYRSTADIVEKANNFIKQNKNRHEKNMIANNTVHIPVKNIILKDYKHQYSYMLRMITETNQELAILYRNNESALPLIDLLEKNSISFRLKESDGIFFSVNVITDIISILEFCIDNTRADLFCEFYYKIGIQIKKSLINDAASLYRKNDISFFSFLEKYHSFEKWQIKKISEIKTKFHRMKRMESWKAVVFILNDLEYNKYIKKHGLEDSRIHTLLSLAVQNPDPEEFISRFRQLKEIVTHGSDTQSSLILSTIHSSKGLEYDNVLMIDVRDGVFPSVSSDSKSEKVMPENILSELEEERRLFYVGVTRAKKSFQIFSYENEYGKPCSPSTFTRQLLNIPEKKSDIRKEIRSGSLVQQSVSERLCRPSAVKKDIRKQIAKFKTGSEIVHKQFGEGIISSLESNICRIQLTDGTVRSFDIEFCVNNNIIRLK